MKSCKFICFFTAVFLTVAYSTLAGPGIRKDKGASNNGPDDPFTACIAEAGNCANFTSAPVRTVDGVPVFNFVQNPGDGTPVLIFDVFQIPGAVVPGSQVSFTFNTLTGSYGAFACDNGSLGHGFSSTGNDLVGPCTVGATDTLASFLTETDSGNTATFTFKGGAGFPSSWTFYTDKDNLGSITVGGGTTTAPEPSSLVLLMAGALLVGFAITKANR
jgi:hypothetical protein